jgi:hypothetical protein
MTSPDDALTLLDDYLSAAMPDAQSAAFEEELFAEAAAGRAPELGYLDAFFEQARWFAARGGFLSGATAQVVAELRELRGVHHIDVEADTQVNAWPADTKLVVYRLAVDLRGYADIDVEITTPEGEHRKWFRDVAYDPADGALYGACDAPLAHSTFRLEPLTAHVVASRGGKRETIAKLNITPK